MLSPTEGEWDSQWVGFSGVVWDNVGQQFKMWYGGGEDEVVAKIGYATALDILNIPGDLFLVIEIKGFLDFLENNIIIHSKDGIQKFIRD